MGMSAAARPGFVTVRGALTAALIAFALAVVIAVVAFADHHRVNAQRWDASLATFYCQHKGTRCDELQTKDLESRWKRRERAYEISFFSLSFVGSAAVIVAFALAWRRRRSARGAADSLQPE